METNKSINKPMPPREGLKQLVKWALENSYCSTAETILEFLRSLYNGSEYKCDLAKVQGFDMSMRRAFCAVVMGVGRDHGFYDHEIRDAFILEGGEEGLRWFLSLGDEDAGLIRYFMTGVTERRAE